MELEKAMTRLARACEELEQVARERSTFHVRRAERMRSENNALLKNDEQVARGLDAAIARVRALVSD